MRRVYEDEINSVGDWNTPPFADVCPSDPLERAKWGWKQDEHGRWYRELAEGQDLWDLPPETPGKPKTHKS